MLGRLVNALLRKGTEPTPEEQPTERTLDAYYNRTLRLRNEILNRNGIVDNIVNAFESTYLDKERFYDVVFLGQGDTHVVLHVGEVVDPENSRPVNLAVRLWHWHDEPYNLGLRSGLLVPQLYAYQDGRWRFRFLPHGFHVKVSRFLVGLCHSRRKRKWIQAE